MRTIAGVYVSSSDERFCFYCFAKLVQREDERNASFAKRDTCDKKCAGLLTAERGRRKTKSLHK